MAASNYSLKVNRELLDPKFESYRLSLDPIPSYDVELDAGETLADVLTQLCSSVKSPFLNKEQFN